MIGATELAPGLYGFDDVEVGDTLLTGTATISADLIDSFADVSGDRYEIHMDEAAARSKGFEGRVAHGLLVLSVVDGLKNNAQARLDGLASLGWTWRFDAPVLAGDTVSARLTIVAKRRTSSGRRGILQIAFDVTNQHGQLVQSGQNELIFAL